MDLDQNRLAVALEIVQRIIEARNLGARVTATSDRRDAIRGADYVITTFQHGGLEAYALDIEIPQRFGVEQVFADSVCPGGVFRALRSIPVLLDICAEMDAVAPDALLVNYVNPMAANCWAVAEGTGRPIVGLCASVRQTSQLLASWAGVPWDDVTFRAAGINHLAFFLTFSAFGHDLYPLIRAAAERPEIYGAEPVRIEMMRRFGYFQTESSGHASEFNGYFRKTAEMVEKDLVPRFRDPDAAFMDFGRTGGYLRAECTERAAAAPDRTVPSCLSLFQEGPRLLEALETHVPFVLNANVPNTAMVENLPHCCCVEVPCVVDGSGIHPTVVGRLPTQLAALMRTNISVQELTVEAALSRDRDAVYHAIALDPLTATACSLDQIHEMVGDLLVAEERWLPKFERAR